MRRGQDKREVAVGRHGGKHPGNDFSFFGPVREVYRLVVDFVRWRVIADTVDSNN